MGKRNYLIEGVSGTGKSSVCEELRRRGYVAIHGDRELAYQGDPTTGERTEGRRHEHHIWDVEKVRGLAANQDDEVTFFCGGSRNLKQFIDLFDEVFILEIDANTLIERLDSRPDDDWGKRKSERELILHLHATKKDIPSNGIVLDATQPLVTVVDELLSHVRILKIKNSNISETKLKLAPLQCANCNAALVVVDAPSLVCRFCGTSNVMPQIYREELRLARDLDSTTREATQQWMRLARIKVPRWSLICAAIAPFVLLTGSLTVLLIAALLGVVNSPALPGLLVYVWLTLIPAQLLAANVAMKNVLVSGAANVGAAFAASSLAASGDPPNCRQCGAPLSVQPDDVLVRCIYCEADNIVLLEKSAMETLRARVASAQSSLAQAMDALTKHAKLASLETRGRTYIITGLLVLPLVWSFVESWNASYWSLLIALDVFVLVMCVFWNVREAFLPPVTIEELEALIGTSSEDHQPPLAPGTRGWYDNASDRVNFLVPAFVTMIFVAIQIIVLRAKR
jgi:hypothetical protein